MKASELRLGNLVNYGVNIVPVKSIHTESVLKNEVRVYVELNENLQNYCLDITEIKPIPLTEEWLLKFGFTEKYKSTSNRWTKVCNGIVFQINDIENEDGELSGIFYYDFMLEIKYVHQLQNLYFALTGEELILNA